MDSDIKLNPAFKDRATSSTLLINESVTRLWEQGEEILQMGFGESRFAVHPKLEAAMIASAARTSYLPARGLPSLCEAVAAYHTDKLSLPISSHQVIIGPGSKALIFALQMALDADLFLPTPSWVSYRPQAELLKRSVVHIPSKMVDDYRFDLDEFDELVKAAGNRQKLLVINSPNNPTGQMLDEPFLRELAEYCRKERVLVLSDEIYFRVQHGETPHCSIAKYYPEGTFILGGPSKHLSVGGWRLGVAIVPDTRAGADVIAALEVIAGEIWASAAAPMQYAALTAYSGDPDIETYIDECADIHGIRTRFLYEQLSALGVHCTKPQGAFYVTANFDNLSAELARSGIRSSPELARHLLERHAIATLAGDSFGIPETTLSLRLATSYLDMEKDSDSKRLLGLFANGLREEEFMSKAHHPKTHAAIDGFSDFIDSVEPSNERRLA
jgi:aspartate/methionine/tyrosine aminotransferase